MKKLKLDELGRDSVEDFKSKEKMPLVLVLDNIRSALNVGSIFRSSDAFAVRQIYLCGITAKPPHKEINKTAIGATESVDWVYEPDVLSCIEKLKASGSHIVAVEQTDQSQVLQNFSVQGKAMIALVLGNEVQGVNSRVLELADEAIEIPQYGTKHSLNVSVCTGVVLWELTKKLRGL